MNLNKEVRWKDKQYIAFDFFDTTIHRNCHPEVILFEWSKKISIYFSFKISATEIYSIRKKSEIHEKQEKQLEEIKYERLLQLVFYTILSRLKSDVTDYNLEDFLIYARTCEEEIELRHISIDTDTINFIEFLKQNGKKIILISDFYSDKKLIEKLMVSLGIRDYFSKIFISSEIGLRKSSGNLYEYVINELSCKPINLLMIGDNIYSDVKVPKKLGIDSYHKSYSDSHVTVSPNDIVKAMNNVISQACTESLFNLYIPEILYFISKLYKELSVNKASDILFCSRECFFIKKLFDLYQKKMNLKLINSHYFYVSRKSTLYPSFKNIEDEDFEVIFRQFPEITLENFLINLNFSNNDINNIAKQTEIKQTDKVSDKSIINKLKQNKLFKDVYELNCKEEKYSFREYLKSVGVENDNSIINMVDIGWKGTIQDNIQKAFPSLNIKGYYMGLNFQRYSTRNSMNKTGILFTDDPQKTKFFNLFNYKYLFYERIFVADHGPTVRYEFMNGVGVPTLDTDENHIEIYRFAEEFQITFFNTFEKILDLFNESLVTPDELFNEIANLSLKKHCIYLPRLSVSIKKLDRAAKENFGIIKSTNRNSDNKVRNFWKNRDFLFLDYIYKAYGKNRLLNPILDIYGYFVYLIKTLQIKIVGDI